MRSRAFVLLVLTCTLAGVLSLQLSPAGARSAQQTDPPVVSVGDLVEFAVTDDRVVRFYLDSLSEADEPVYDVRVRRADARSKHRPAWKRLRPTTHRIVPARCAPAACCA